MASGDKIRPEGQNKLKQTDLASLTGYQVKRAYVRLHNDFRTSMAPFDLTQRVFSMLSLVCENPGVTQSAVSRELGIERSGTVVIVDHLEARGLISRNRISSDRRAYALHATDAGTALYGKALGAVRAHETRMMQGFSPDDVATLRLLLERIGAT